MKFANKMNAKNDKVANVRRFFFIVQFYGICNCFSWKKVRSKICSQFKSKFYNEKWNLPRFVDAKIELGFWGPNKYKNSKWVMKKMLNC